MAPPIRKTKFIPEWIDMRPKITVPKIDWIQKQKLGIAYGNEPLQQYDLYYPPKETGKPRVKRSVLGGCRNAKG